MEKTQAGISDLKCLLINASNASPLHKGICLSCYLQLQRLDRHVSNSFGIHVEYTGSCKSRMYLSNARSSKLNHFFLFHSSETHMQHFKCYVLFERTQPPIKFHFVLHVLSFLIWRLLIYWAGAQLVLKQFSWNHCRYIMVPSGNMGVFDPTEIHNRGQLKSHMKEAMIKLGFHLLCFFMYLYR